MNESRLKTIEQIREFLGATAEVAFKTPPDETQRHAFVATVIKRFRYFKQAKPERGVLFAYMKRLSGYSRQHLSRLITQFRKEGQIQPKTRANRTSFRSKFTPEDLILLAEVDNLHDGLSGPATQALLHRSLYRLWRPALRAALPDLRLPPL